MKIVPIKGLSLRHWCTKFHIDISSRYWVIGVWNVENRIHAHTHPHENEIYMRHIQLLGMKIYFEGLGIIYVKYILANISQKIYTKYIRIIQLFAKIYFIYFDIYIFPCGHTRTHAQIPRRFFHENIHGENFWGKFFIKI